MATKQLNICGGKLRPSINTEDDVLMVKQNLRPPKLQFNHSFKYKTNEERKKLKKIKSKNSPKNIKNNKNKSKVGNLTLHFKNEKRKKDFKTTIRLKDIKENEIPSILKEYQSKNQIIIKSYFNVPGHKSNIIKL